MDKYPGALAIVVGHTRIRPGAYGVYPIDTHEYQFNTSLSDLLQKVATARGHECEIFFRDDGDIEGAYHRAEQWEPDAIIELHFNAFNKKVRGTETLYSDSEDLKRTFEKQFAEAVQHRMCECLKRKGKADRGIKDRPLSRGERGYWNVNQSNHTPSILVEPFFGDNPADAKLAVEKKLDICEAIIDGFHDWKRFVSHEANFIANPAIEHLSPPATSATPSTPGTPGTPNTPETPETPETRETRETRGTRRT